MIFDGSGHFVMLWTLSTVEVTYRQICGLLEFIQMLEKIQHFVDMQNAKRQLSSGVPKL